MPGGLGRTYCCECRECAWCRDALIEAAEMIGSGRLSIPYALVSPLWYQREAVAKYNEWKEKGWI